MLDCLIYSKKQITRRKLDADIIDGFRFNKWRFGLPDSSVLRLLREMKHDWQPDRVLITSLNSVWWEAVRDTVHDVREVFPDAKIEVGGTYPSTYFEHARQNVNADCFHKGSKVEAQAFVPDLALYETPPSYAGIQFYDYSHSENQLQPRSTDEVVTEIRLKAEQGVYRFSFFDTEIQKQHHDDFCLLLDELAKLNLKQRTISLMGNIAPETITQDLAKRLQPAYVKEIYFHCGLDFTDPSTIRYTDTIEEYQRAVNLLERNGFPSRTGSVTAMLVAGLPYEDLEGVTERVIKLARIVGSVIIVPYQYSPHSNDHPLIRRAVNQNGQFSPEMWNSKLFPLARLSGKKMDDYIELLRLTRLLNSKYRSVTFDFLGESFVAQLFRQSIRSEGYDPFDGPDTPTESIQLPVLSK